MYTCMIHTYVYDIDLPDTVHMTLSWRSCDMADRHSWR